MKFSGKVGNGPVNNWLNFGGNSDHRLDTGIVFLIWYYWEIGKAGLHFSYDVITSQAHDIVRLVKMGRGGGMHCPSASSLNAFW